MRGYRLFLSIVILSVFLGATAHAQTAFPWQKTCTDKNNPKTCRISQTLYLSKEINGKQKIIGLILGLTVLYLESPETKKRLPYLNVRMPLGVDLRPGAIMRIDKGAQIPLQYLRCTKTGCEASLQLEPRMVEALKSGKTMRIGFRPWGKTKITVIKASLSGFTWAYWGLK